MPDQPKKTYSTPVKNYLETGITHLPRPKLQWTTIQTLGTLGGGLNAGIAKTRFKDDPLNRIFIEKRFKPRDIEERTAHKEVTLLKQVGDHAHITRMYDHFIDEKARRAGVYLEFCDKGSLQDVLRQCDGTRRINEHKLWEWLGQVMEALVYCHLGPSPEDEKGRLDWATIYHRDIKPGNILLTRDKTKTRIIAKLADFGCAISDEWTFQTKHVDMASNASPRTPGYDPPEYPKFSGASDVWQLALVLVCVCNYERAAPRSRLNRAGKQWDRVRTAGPLHSRAMSEVLKSCLVEDAARRPGALHSLKAIRDAYNGIRQTLPADLQPLEIFEKVGRDRINPKDSKSPSDFKQHGQHSAAVQSYPVASPGPMPVLQRLRLPAHVLSDPGAGQGERMSYNYMDFLSDHRYPQSPFSNGQHTREVSYLHDIRDDEEGDADDYFMLDSVQAVYGGQHQYQGGYPPLHPRRRRSDR